MIVQLLAHSPDAVELSTRHSLNVRSCGMRLLFPRVPILAGPRVKGHTDKALHVVFKDVDLDGVKMWTSRERGQWLKRSRERDAQDGGLEVKDGDGLSEPEMRCAGSPLV